MLLSMLVSCDGAFAPVSGLLFPPRLRPAPLRLHSFPAASAGGRPVFGVGPVRLCTPASEICGRVGGGLQVCVPPAVSFTRRRLRRPSAPPSAAPAAVSPASVEFASRSSFAFVTLIRCMRLCLSCSMVSHFMSCEVSAVRKEARRCAVLFPPHFLAHRPADFVSFVIF